MRAGCGCYSHESGLAESYLSDVAVRKETKKLFRARTET